MSVTIVCDYCGEPIEDNVYATMRVSGDFEQDDDSKAKGYRIKFCNWDYGHFHAGKPDSDRPDCWWRINDAVELAKDAGPTLETIPTISNHQVAARRRKHTKGDE